MSPSVCPGKGRTTARSVHQRETCRSVLFNAVPAAYCMQLLLRPSDRCKQLFPKLVNVEFGSPSVFSCGLTVDHGLFKKKH